MVTTIDLIEEGAITTKNSGIIDADEVFKELNSSPNRFININNTLRIDKFGKDFNL